MKYLNCPCSSAGYLPAGRQGASAITYYVYVLISKKYNNRLYIELTINLNQRIKEHNIGKTKSTKYYRPWELVYSEKFNTRIEARKRELQLKAGSGREFLKEVIKYCPCSSAG